MPNLSILFGTPEFPDWISTIQKSANGVNNISVQIANLDNNISSSNFDIIIPITFDQQRYLSENMNNPNILYLCNESTPDNINILDNKCLFVNFMKDNNLGQYIPTVLYMKHNNSSNYVDGISELNYPCIFKYAITFAAKGTKIYTQDNKFIPDPNNKRIKDYLIQEYIPGDQEYGGHFLVIDGKILYRVYYNTVHNTPSGLHIQKGRMMKYTTVNLSDTEESVFQNIFSKLNYTGFACANFKIHENLVKIFEINPRLGGTFMNNKKDFNNMLEIIKQYKDMSI